MVPTREQQPVSSVTSSAFWIKYGPWIGFCVAAAAYYPRFALRPGLSLYTQAAGCLTQQQAMADCSLAFTYPPFFAFVMIPFLALPHVAQTVVWYLISLGCAVLACRIAEAIAVRLIPGPWSQRELGWLRVIAVLLSLKFILAVLEDEAFDLLALPFLLYGVLAVVEGRAIRAGFALAIAAALKVTPLLFLPYLVLRRQFVAAGVFVVVLGVASVLPDLFFTPAGAAHGYLGAWLRDIGAASVLEHGATVKLAFWDGVNIHNLSLRGALARAVDGTPWQAHFLVLLRATQVVFVALIAVLILASLRLKALVPVDACLLVIAMLMLSPMTSRSHFVNMVLPFFVLVAAWLKDHHTRWLGATVLVLSFIGGTGIPRDLAPRALTDFMRDHNDVMWSALVLIVYLATLIIAPQNWGIGAKVDAVNQASAA
ncbi:MAG: glycosyltransferase family 87 protein [Xanthobacteraceae bacterium]|nr:glycosyltransferase family 87 protein [Xanthobacteraceae bacterium]